MRRWGSLIDAAPALDIFCIHRLPGKKADAEGGGLCGLSVDEATEKSCCLKRLFLSGHACRFKASRGDSFRLMRPLLPDTFLYETEK